MNTKEAISYIEFIEDHGFQEEDSNEKFDNVIELLQQGEKYRKKNIRLRKFKEVVIHGWVRRIVSEIRSSPEEMKKYFPNI